MRMSFSLVKCILVTRASDLMASLDLSHARKRRALASRLSEVVKDNISPLTSVSASF